MDPAAAITYEQYAGQIFASPVYDPAGVFVAVLGDEWAAMTGLHFPPGQDLALAQALKLLAVEYARSRGRRRVATGNNERNPAMLAVNRKFGFRPLPGMYAMDRVL